MSSLTNTSAADSAATQFVQIGSHRLAYRTIGSGAATPLVLSMRFRGVMDEWDPAFLDALALTRRIYWFDSAGVGLSTGEVPEHIPGMARVLIEFVEALGLGLIDLLGWSMGGYVAQNVALQRPDMVRRLIVAASGPGGVPNAPSPPPKVWEVASKPVNDNDDFLYLFFPETPEGIKAGRQHLARLGQRVEAPEPPVSAQGVKNQMASFASFRERDSMYPHLFNFATPILFANGMHDVMIPAYNCYAAAQRAPHAKLILYPASGHGFLFQYYAQFSRDIETFLDGK